VTLSFTTQGWDSYCAWRTDARTLKRIHQLIADIERNGNSGIGQPERLSGDWSGWWSRHIDEKNRLIYRLTERGIEIAQCGGRYADR